MRRSKSMQQAVLHEVDADAAGRLKAVATLPTLDSLPHQDEAELVSLLQAAYILIPDRQTRLIQFVGATGGEGVSTLARRFAMYAASRLPDTICLFDLDPKLSAHAEFFGLDEMGSASTVDGSAPSHAGCMYHLSSLGLYVASSSASASSSVGRHSDYPFELPAHDFERVAQEVRRQFSLIVVDSPPLAKSAEALLTSQQVDGVILVIEAEQTNTAAASVATRKIAQAGGNLLGAVLNKRRRYLPRFLASLIQDR